MGVLLLCGTKGVVLDITARGEGAEDAVNAIGALIANRFGEEE
jgi:phosphotransferase system HPr-like phosphotransfer protein